jgi:SET domain-containing protein
MVAEGQKPQSTTTAFIPYKRFQDKGGKERKKEIVTEKRSRQLRVDLKAAAATTTTTGSSKEKEKKKQSSTTKTKRRGK